jgi:hypothetical protein
MIEADFTPNAGIWAEVRKYYLFDLYNQMMRAKYTDVADYVRFNHEHLLAEYGRICI